MPDPSGVAMEVLEEHHDLVRVRAWLGDARLNTIYTSIMPAPVQARGVILRGESDQDPDQIGRERVSCSKDIPVFLEHGTKKVNKVGLVAPTGYVRTYIIQV